jgi:hypothetical protein
VCGAAVGVYFVAASVPELKAATHHHASATPAAAAAASSEHRVSDQQRADAES